MCFKLIKKRLICLIIMIAAFAVPFASTTPQAFAEEFSLTEPDTNRIPGWPAKKPIYGQSCVLLDNETNAVICSLNRDTQRYPASTTKVMTCLLALENLDLGATVTMTEEGVAGVADDSSNAGTVVGEEFTVEQCLYMLMLKSANDIANQLAVEMGGSLEGFADMMNERALSIGCTGTHFHNPSGLPDEEHYTTAMDLALIFQEALRNEKFREIISTLTYTVPPTNKYDDERTYSNHNSLIDPDSEYYCEECIGGKTGFTNAAQRTLVTAAEKNGRTLICVTMKTPDKSDYIDQDNLYIYGFDYFSPYPLEGGSVILPNDMDTSGLTALIADHKRELEEAAGYAVSGAESYVMPSDSPFSASYEAAGEGLEKVTYYYDSLPVGTALIEVPQPVVVSVVEEVVDDTWYPDDRKPILTDDIPFIPVLLIVAIAAALAALYFYKKNIDKKRARLRREASERRRAARSRREAEEAEEAAASGDGSDENDGAHEGEESEGSEGSEGRVRGRRDEVYDDSDPDDDFDDDDIDDFDDDDDDDGDADL